MTTPDGLIATVLGVGLSPKAPGTAGSLAALVPAWFLLELTIEWQLLVIVAGFALGVAACSRFERRLGTHDHGAIVWDEVIGVWITLIGAPATPLVLLLGFVYFRVFDILKPWPVRWFDRRVGGGMGVMIDDVVAALIALAALTATRALVPAIP